jgi:hypothetical protein
MADPWAILLIHFSDDDTEPFDKAWYRRMFTAEGAGDWGMYDWFRDNSHGRVDLAGSEVFGWYTLDMKTSEYIGNGQNQDARRDLVIACKEKARAEGVAVDDFAGTLVILNYGRDLFGGGEGAVAGDDGKNLDVSGLAPAIIAQEMCHVYGLQHSKRLGSPEVEYGDSWDMMSSLGPYSSANPAITTRTVRGELAYPIGPGLNAANMWSQGWLDESRVWSPSGETVSERVTLRPLHRRDLDGHLAARFGELFIELRVAEGWDAGIPRATVLVHLFEQGSSWLVADSKGSFEWTAGSVSGAEGMPAAPAELDLGVVEFTVEQIDAEARSATLRFTRTTGRGAPQFMPEWWLRRRWGWEQLETMSAGESLLVTPHDVTRIPAATRFDVSRQIVVPTFGLDDTAEETVTRITGSAPPIDAFLSPRMPDADSEGHG